MRRHENGALRPSWETQIQAEGLVYSRTRVGEADVSYWREAQYYSFTSAETDLLAAAANEVFGMCVAAGDHIIAENLFGKMGIAPWAVPAIVTSWNDEDHADRFSPSVYGRFDVRYGNHPDLVAADPSLAVPKFLEFNADTPTALLETASVQWNWLLGNDAVQHRDQWNNVFDALKTAWRRNLDLLRARTGRPFPLAHFLLSSADDSGEDLFTTTCMADAAHEIGLEVQIDYVENIKLVESADPGAASNIAGYPVAPGRFIDSKGRDIELAFKLYPWEALSTDAWGQTVLWNTLQPWGTVWVEPPYKMMWSNKGILPILWELFGSDPVRSQYLLPAYFAGEEPAGFVDYAEKPLLGREGANVRLMRGGAVVAAEPGHYGDTGWVRQALAPLPDFAGVDGPHHPVLGVWMVDGEAAGLGIRESDGLITDNKSYFAPHCIIDDENGFS